MQKKGNENQNNIKAKNKGLFMAFSIIVYVSFIIIVACVIIYFVDLFGETKSYFTEHFAISIILALIGVIALLLPRISKKSYSGDDKGDKLMNIVGVLLLACSIFSLVMSYLS